MRQDEPQTPPEPYLTVLIPVRNEESHIASTLEMLAAQDYPPSRFEVLVIDGQSTDSTRRLVRGFIAAHPDLHVQLLHNPRQWSSSARNIGVRQARGQLVAVIDAHVYIPTDGLFKAMEELKERNDALCLARPAPLLVPGLTGTERSIALARNTWLGHSQESYIYKEDEGFVEPMSSGFAYDRSVFDRIGFFDEHFDAAEDVEFHWRLAEKGIKAYTSPKLTIYSYPRSSLRGLFRQMTRYGVGRASLLRKHPEAFTKETLVPPALVLLFTMTPVAAGIAVLCPVGGILYGSLIVAYCLVLMATAVGAAFEEGRLSAAPMIACAIWTTHMGLGWGLLRTLPKRPGLRSQAETTS